MSVLIAKFTWPQKATRQVDRSCRRHSVSLPAHSHCFTPKSNTGRHRFDNKERKSTGEVSNRSVWMFYSINSVQCWELFYKNKKIGGEKEKGEKKKQSYCKHTQKYKHCPRKKNNGNVTWAYSSNILTWLQEADNDSCGWYAPNKRKERKKK